MVMIDTKRSIVRYGCLTTAVRLDQIRGMDRTLSCLFVVVVVFFSVSCVGGGSVSDPGAAARRQSDPLGVEQGAAGSGASAEQQFCRCWSQLGTAKYVCEETLPLALESLGECPKAALIRSCSSCPADWTCEECLDYQRAHQP